MKGDLFESTSCQVVHDVFADVLSAGLIVGLIISYAPQHLRIINKGSSEGFSPWFLLLGSTSSASGMLNIVIKQWGVISCCRVWNFGTCLEAAAGVIQVALLWLLFDIILVLYMIYYPPHLKYLTVTIDSHDSRSIRPDSPQRVRTNVKTDEWRTSVVLAWVVLIHLILITFVTFLLLSFTQTEAHSTQLDIWATFLGLFSGGVAVLQYYPQLLRTYRTKLVGALSIPMMVIQTPGGLVMVLSIALRPGTNWTSWIMYLVAAIMQGILLVLCLAWKRRQHRLGIDDFGVPIPSIHSHDNGPGGSEVPVRVGMRRGSGVEDGETVGDAVEEAVEGSIIDEEGAMFGHQEVDGSERTDVSSGQDERTALLGKDEGERKGLWGRLTSWAK